MIEQSRHNEIARAILTMGAIRYVPLSSKDGFFVFKYPGSLLFPYEDKDVNNSYFFAQLNKNKDHRLFPVTYYPKNFCYIYHNDVLIQRKITSEGTLKWNGEIEEYLKNYSKEYNAAPEFLLDTLFTVKAVEKDWSDDFGLCSIMPDYLISRKDVEISSQAHGTRINNLLREVGLLKENRKRRLNEDMKGLKQIIRDKYQKNPKLTAKELEDLLAHEADKKFPNDAEMAESCYRSPSQVWRWINPKM